MNVPGKDAYNDTLALVERVDNGNANRHPMIDVNYNDYSNNIPLKNGEELASQGIALINEGLITDDITVLQRTQDPSQNEGLPDTTVNSLNDRLEIVNKSITFKKNSTNTTSYYNNSGVLVGNYNNSYEANKISPDNIVIKSENGEKLIDIDTSGNQSGSIEIKKSDGTVLFKISQNGLFISVPTNLTQNANLVNNSFTFKASKQHAYQVANQNYVDKKFRTDFETEYWRDVSTRLVNVDKNAKLIDLDSNNINSKISYPAKIKEYVQQDKVPIRYEYEMIENCKMTKLGFNNNNNGSLLRIEPYEAPVFKKYPGSNYIIGTNPNWCFTFSRARKKTVKKGGIDEIVYDDNGNPVYETDQNGKLVIDTIHI